MNYGKYGRDLLLELQQQQQQQPQVQAADSTAAALWFLPAYNDTTVQAALQDLRLHVQALQDQVTAASNAQTTKKPSLAVRPSLLLQEAAIQRNKRCLLTYHWVRLQRLQRMLVLTGQNNMLLDTTTTTTTTTTSIDDNVDNSSSTRDNNNNINKNLAPAEQEFVREYQALQERFVEHCGLTTFLTDGSLTAHRFPPTANDRVTVRVVQSVLPESRLSSTSSGGSGAPSEQEVVLNSGLSIAFVLGSTHSLLWSDALEWIRAGVLQVVRQEEED